MVTSNTTDPAQPTDNFGLIQTLINRFGEPEEQALIKAFQESWITRDDLQTIRNKGYNAVRVPVWWANFYSFGNVSNGGFRSDAFDELDRIVNAASAVGLYVIIDLHGAPGGQSCNESTGHAGPNGNEDGTGQPCSGGDGSTNRFWSNGTDQGNTQWLWWQIANHYKGNAAVAGYDLLNEPRGASSKEQVWGVYNDLYKAVRSADPDHMIFLEGAFGGYGNWNWDELPDPAQYGWTNVVYEMHEYQWAQTSDAARSGADRQVSDFNNHASWNVPGLIGEFNPLTTGSADWAYSVNDYDRAGLSWTMWTFKSSNSPVPNFWGMFDTNNTGWAPNVNTDSPDWIAKDWQMWTTPSAFSENTTGL